MIRKMGTDEVYDIAIDVENAPYEYEETDEKIGEAKEDQAILVFFYLRRNVKCQKYLEQTLANGNWFIGDVDTGKPSQGTGGGGSSAPYNEFYLDLEPFKNNKTVTDETVLNSFSDVIKNPSSYKIDTYRSGSDAVGERNELINYLGSYNFFEHEKTFAYLEFAYRDKLYNDHSITRDESGTVMDYAYYMDMVDMENMLWVEYTAVYNPDSESWDATYNITNDMTGEQTFENKTIPDSEYDHSWGNFENVDNWYEELQGMGVEERIRFKGEVIPRLLKSSNGTATFGFYSYYININFSAGVIQNITLGEEIFDYTTQPNETLIIGKTSNDTLVRLEPNQLYVFPEMESLEIRLGGIINRAIVQEYKFRFTSGETPTTLTLPSSVKGEIIVEANKIYEVSIIDNLLLSHSWELN